LKKVCTLALLILVAKSIFSQDTLPRFTLAERGNKVTISWTNPFQSLVQLNVQRSFDSLRNFSTVFSPTSPELPQNGYTDVKPATNRYYYRIFYVLQGGSYFFSKSRRANGSNSDGAAASETKDVARLRDLTNGAFTSIVPGDKRNVTIKIKDAFYRRLSINSFRNFRDSILMQTRDTLYPINDTSVGLSQYAMVQAYRSSPYVFVNKDGYINVSLPSVKEKKYHLKFFEEDGTSLFEIPAVKESPLMLDKANFVHSGWFIFELYEDNKLKEKNKFYLNKDF
jgi:hypothetical protein